MSIECLTESSRPYHDLVKSISKAYSDESQNYPWIIGFSGGKDSTLVTHLAFDAVMNVSPTRRRRDIYIVWNDTLVESPFVTKHVNEQIAHIGYTAKCFKLPITTVITSPHINETFWVLLIGKGYPSPNRKMRWCTDRLKIKPTSKFIKDNVSTHGSAIIVLGVRKDESINRRRTISKYTNNDDSYLTPHNSLSGALIYRPIVDISTADVWHLLGHNDPPWGGTHEKLIQMYRDAEGGECPMVLSKDEAPGCGTNSSRFGCWVCTVVTKDKSLQGFVNSGQSKYQLLIDFRDWLQEIRNDPEYRQIRRRNGRIEFYQDKNIAGPFTINARRMILDKLLRLQEKYNERLISDEEISIIKRCWIKDIADRHTLATNYGDTYDRQ